MKSVSEPRYGLKRRQAFWKRFKQSRIPTKLVAMDMEPLALRLFSCNFNFSLKRQPLGLQMFLLLPQERRNFQLLSENLCSRALQ